MLRQLKRNSDVSGHVHSLAVAHCRTEYASCCTAVRPARPTRDRALQHTQHLYLPAGEKGHAQHHVALNPQVAASSVYVGLGWKLPLRAGQHRLGATGARTTVAAGMPTEATLPVKPVGPYSWCPNRPRPLFPPRPHSIRTWFHCQNPSSPPLRAARLPDRACRIRVADGCHSGRPRGIRIGRDAKGLAKMHRRRRGLLVVVLPGMAARPTRIWAAATESPPAWLP